LGRSLLLLLLLAPRSAWGRLMEAVLPPGLAAGLPRPKSSFMLAHCAAWVSSWRRERHPLCNISNG
jgi:hypothetical protein